MGQGIINTLLVKPFFKKVQKGDKLIVKKLRKYQRSNEKNNVSPREVERTKDILKKHVDVSV